MSNIEYFLTHSEEEAIIETIRKVEASTSGEIRVHIERDHAKEAYPRAHQVFHLLKMDNTRLQNGVLIYIAVDDKQFAIYGDKGIHDKVKFEFWKSTRSLLETHFKEGHFKDGIVECIETIGKELTKHFPWSPYDDNELTDEISKG